MSQIAAVFSEAPLQSGRFKAMVGSLAQRPHDASASWSDGCSAIAACTLHTTEESSDAEQPHVGKDGRVVLVFDGYLTNYEELKRDLLERGAMIQNRSDGELALRAYEQWGEACTAHLDGEFAVIAIDKQLDTVFCARDHQGLRPLYYALDGGALIIASDVATVIAGMKAPPQPNFEFLAQLSIATISAIEQTAWSGIHRLPMAHSLSFTNGQARLAQYYSLPPAKGLNFKSDEEQVEAYLEMLSDVVRRASRTGQPLGFDVSGGLDSSSLYCLGHRLKERGQLRAPSIRGYTLVGEPGSPADEIEFARAAAAHVGGNLTETPLFSPDLNWFAQLTHREQDIATFPNAAQSVDGERQMASDGVRVVINGNGGDQWLDGSSGFLEQNLRALQLTRFWRNIANEIGLYGSRVAVPSLLRRSTLAMLPLSVRAALREFRADATGQRAELHRFLPQEIAQSIEAKERSVEAGYSLDPVVRSQQMSFASPWTQFSNDLMNRQRASNGIEGRSPMLSRQFIEFCAALPEDFKRRGGQGRWIHRKALDNILPPKILNRRTKAGFPVCLQPEDVISALQGHWPDGMDHVVDEVAMKQMLNSKGAHELQAEMPFELWGLHLLQQFLLDFALQ